jgi:hypothetical protein
VFQQDAAVERFHQEGDRSISQCLLSDIIVIMSRNEDNGQLTPFTSDPSLQFGSVQAG